MASCNTHLVSRIARTTSMRVIATQTLSWCLTNFCYPAWMIKHFSKKGTWYRKIPSESSWNEWHSGKSTMTTPRWTPFGTSFDSTTTPMCLMKTSERS